MYMCLCAKSSKIKAILLNREERDMGCILQGVSGWNATPLVGGYSLHYDGILCYVFKVSTLLGIIYLFIMENRTLVAYRIVSVLMEKNIIFIPTYFHSSIYSSI